jgi:predicted SAM-dependent methyltransferase
MQVLNAVSLQPAASTEPVRLDLACGQTPKDGFKGVDLYAPGAEKVDVLKFPWPWKANSVDELHSSHFLEHIPARNFEDRDRAFLGPALAETFSGKDLLCCFMDEAWRVLKHNGIFTVIVPNARCNRAFQDPTHRRFFVDETFLYFNKGWREAQKLGHYLGICDFAVQTYPVVPVEMTTLHPLAQQRRFNESWNVILDWSVRLVANKPDQ